MNQMCLYLGKDLTVLLQKYQSQMVYSEHKKYINKEYHQQYYVDEYGTLQQGDNICFNYRYYRLWSWSGDGCIYNLGKGRVAQLPPRYFYSRPSSHGMAANNIL